MDDQRAGHAEVWAARAWNVFNEGRPFGVVYPPMATAAALALGIGPEGAVGWGLVAGLALSLVWARYAFPLRGRALLWLLLVPALAVLDAGRGAGLIAVGLGGWLLFTWVIWGTVYYHLRTGAPWGNFRRFWRLIATNSDPTSGNAGEQVPKIAMTLAAISHVAAEPGAGSAGRVGAVAAAAAVLGVIAHRRWAAVRTPRYPAAATGTGPGRTVARRVYVIVIDGCNRDRLRQASALGLTPVLDRLAAEGTEYLDVQTAYPARTVVCFSSMLTGATPAEHGMRSNFAPRLGVRVPAIFDVLEARGRRGRIVGIAHLLDPFPDHVRSVTSVQPTPALDHSLVAAARAVVDEEDPDLLVLQLLAADQMGHVRGTRNREYVDQLGATDQRIGEFLGFLRSHGRLEGATVVVMADHGQGRGIGGHGHLDWGETPVPFVVWGAGALPGAVCVRPSSVLELATTVAALLGVPVPSAARGRPLVPALDPDVRPAAPPEGARALALVGEREGADLPAAVDGVPLDVRREKPSHDDHVAVLHVAGGAGISRDQVERVLRPVLEGRAPHVTGSRFLGSGSRPSLIGRVEAAWLGFRLGGAVVTDARPPLRALAADGDASIPPLELPLELRGHSATGERHARHSRNASTARPATTPAATASAHADPTP